MKVFIDFDDVLFNTKGFSMYLKNFFQCQGISEDLYQKYYYASEDTGAIKLFNPWGLLDRLEKNEGLDVQKLRENFLQSISELSQFVFADVENFLKNIGKENIYLISFGLASFQNEKILASGVSRMVTGCIVTQSSKAQAISRVIEQMNIDCAEEIIFIDDRIEQVQDVKQHFADFYTFLLCRKEGRYCDEKNEFCDYEIHNLDEAREIIKNLKK